MTPQDIFNIALLLIAVSIAILIAAIVYNSKSKETLREAKDISAKAKETTEEAYRQRDVALDSYHRADNALSDALKALSEAKMEAKTLKDNLQALGSEIPNPSSIPEYHIEESDLCVRVTADYRSVVNGCTVTLLIRSFIKADNPTIAWSKANKLLTALKK